MMEGGDSSLFEVSDSQMTLVHVKWTKTSQHIRILSLVSSNSLMAGSVYL